MSIRETWHDRPPVVVVCPDCESGIYQHRHGHAIDCPECTFSADGGQLTQYDIVRFDCPECGADIENWATRDLGGDGPPNTVVSVECEECGMWWDAPNE